MRVTMTLNDELLSRIDTYAKLNYMNRSSVVSFACNQFLLQAKLQLLLADMKIAIEKIANNENLTDENKKKIEEFETLFNAFSNK